VDVADFGRAGQGVDVAVVFEILRGVLETVAARLLLGDVVATDGRAHRTVNNGHTFGQEAAESGFGGSGRDDRHEIIIVCLHQDSLIRKGKAVLTK
jgi:hypothetical protein